MFSEDSTLSLRNASLEIAIHYTKIWRFLKGDLKPLLYTLQMRQKISGEHKDKRIDFAQDCRNALKVIPNS